MTLLFDVPLAAALAVFALLAFGIATWRGRWGLWVTGYLLCLAALAVAFLEAP